MVFDIYIYIYLIFIYIYIILYIYIYIYLIFIIYIYLIFIYIYIIFHNSRKSFKGNEKNCARGSNITVKILPEMVLSATSAEKILLIQVLDIGLMRVGDAI